MEFADHDHCYSQEFRDKMLCDLKKANLRPGRGTRATEAQFNEA